jgi:tetratricopeptide (TPR) repeat protein
MGRSTLDKNLQLELDVWQKITLPAVTVAHYLLVTAYMKQQNRLAAKNALTAFQQANGLSKDPLTLSLLGHACVAVGDNQLAVDYYQQALKLKPDYSVAQLGIENYMKQLGELSNKEVRREERAKNLSHLVANNPNAFFAIPSTSSSQPVNVNFANQLAEQRTLSFDQTSSMAETGSGGSITTNNTPILHEVDHAGDNDEDKQLAEATRLSLALNK